MTANGNTENNEGLRAWYEKKKVLITGGGGVHWLPFG